MPSMVPSFAQTTNVPSSEPTNGVALSSQGPTQLPTSSPSLGTSTSPTSTPISTSSKLPSFSPSSAPTSQRIKPSYRPSSEPSQEPTIETNEPTVVTLKPILRSTKKPSTKPVVVTTRPSVSSSISSVSVMPTAPLSASCNGPIIPPPITYLPAQFTLVQPFGNYTGSSVSNSSLSVFAVTLQCILRGNKYAAFTPLVLASLSSNANPTIALTAIQPTTIYVAFIVKFFVPPTSSTLLSAYYGNLTSAISASFVSGQFTAVLHQIAQTQHLSIALGSVVAQQQAPIYTKAVPLGVSSAPLKNVQPSNSPVASSSSTNSGTNDFFSTGNMPVYILVIAIAILLPVLIWLWCSSGRRRPDRIDLADKQLQNWTIAPVVDVPIVSKHIVTKPQKSNSVEDFYYEVSQKQAVPRNAGPLSNAHSAVVAPTDSRYNRNQKAILNEYLKSQQRSNPSYREPTLEVSPRPNLNSSSSSNNGMYDTATAGPRMWNAADADVSDPWEEEYRYKEYQQFQSWMEENPAAKENAAIDPEPWQRDEQYRKYREFQGKKDDVISTQKILQQQLLEFELQKELMKSRPPPPVQQSSHSNRDYGYNQSRSNRDYQPERERDPRGLDQGYSSRERPRGERSRKDDRDYGRERPYSQREYDEREGGQYSRGPRDKSRERQRDIERDRSRRR